VNGVCPGKVAAEPADVAGLLAGRTGGTIGGPGASAAASDVPDVWMYDSIVTDPNRLVDLVRAYRSIDVAPDREALLQRAATGGEAVLTSEQQVTAGRGGLTALTLEPAVQDPAQIGNIFLQALIRAG
jgi:hypothetical protein